MQYDTIYKQDGSAYTILVVEDIEINQLMAVHLFESMGCIVFLAENGIKAVSMVKENDFDVVFMDLEMPKMNGYDATKAIRKYEKEQDHKTPLPIIALTAKVFRTDRERCLQVGMNDCVTKPVKRPEVVQVINKWCGRYAEMKNQW